MKKIIYWIVLFNLWLLAVCSCKNNSPEKEKKPECLPQPDISKINLQVDFIRIDKKIVLAKSVEEIRQILKEHPDYNQEYLVRQAMPNMPQKGDIMEDILWTMAKEPYMDSLMIDYEKRIDIPRLQQELTDLFKRVKAFFPDFVPPKVYFSMSGIGSFPLNKSTDIFVSKKGNILVIGLDWFLGPDYKYPLPENIPLYIAKRYVGKNIPIFVAEIISSRYNQYDPNNATMLNDMLTYAKTFYFAQNVIPCLPDSSVLGYTPNQMDYIQQKKSEIWKHYLDKKIFFETSNRIKRDYVEESPFTLPISQDCPGGIARWTGLQILKKYAYKKKLDLPKVMKLQDPQEVLNESGYKGE
jgi:hypothetical protein